MITIDEVRKLNAERTEGEWTTHSSDRDVYIEVCLKEPPHFLISKVSKGTGDIADTKFIAASPDIANLAIQLSEENDRLREALRKLEHLGFAPESGLEKCPICAISPDEINQHIFEALNNKE